MTEGIVEEKPEEIRSSVDQYDILAWFESYYR